MSNRPAFFCGLHWRNLRGGAVLAGLQWMQFTESSRAVPIPVRRLYVGTKGELAIVDGTLAHPFNSPTSRPARFSPGCIA
ncbi:MAG: hypothetical protein KDN22_32630 [Verrucomicrobiae bacterium]|nr:hypothetical protein [Verrucomicrobiae bacterium]